MQWFLASVPWHTFELCSVGSYLTNTAESWEFDSHSILKSVFEVRTHDSFVPFTIFYSSIFCKLKFAILWLIGVSKQIQPSTSDVTKSLDMTEKFITCGRLCLEVKQMFKKEHYVLVMLSFDFKSGKWMQLPRFVLFRPLEFEFWTPYLATRLSQTSCIPMSCVTSFIAALSFFDIWRIEKT
jgi:hypothetical protein